MFGKKKESGIPVGHYEGIEGFATDYPCRIEVKGDVFEIRRIKPETTVTLPMNRIKSFSAMEEEKFMLKYHGQAKNTSKLKGAKKYYLVVEYDKGIGCMKYVIFTPNLIYFSKTMSSQRRR